MIASALTEFDEPPKSARSLALENYYEMLRNAVTVKDAWQLHSAVIKFLSDEIYYLNQEELPEYTKTQAANNLEHSRHEHAEAALRLHAKDTQGGGAISYSQRFNAANVPKSARSLLLEDYYARLRDVYDLQEAMILHTEIIDQLVAEIYALNQEELPEPTKKEATSELKQCLSQHARALGRLTGIQQKNEQFGWQLNVSREK